MCRLFPCIPIFRGFYIKKTFKKKCVCVVGLKIALLLVKNVFINMKNGMSELSCWVAAKQTTQLHLHILWLRTNPWPCRRWIQTCIVKFKVKLALWILLNICKTIKSQGLQVLVDIEGYPNLIIITGDEQRPGFTIVKGDNLLLLDVIADFETNIKKHFDCKAKHYQQLPAELSNKYKVYYVNLSLDATGITGKSNLIMTAMNDCNEKLWFIKRNFEFHSEYNKKYMHENNLLYTLHA